VIEFTALAILCGIAARAFGERADQLSLRRRDSSAQIAFVADTVLGFLLLVAALMFFVLALITAPWGSVL
jgi:hypothetical protein